MARTTPATPSLTSAADRVRDLQRTLYRAAKADPSRRFHALYDKLYRSDVLERAWAKVRAAGGAAGIDRTTLADIEAAGVEALLAEPATDLRAKRYRPLPGRRVWIPKPASRERRPLSIPAVEAVAGTELRQGNWIPNVSDELLDAVAHAYREAVGQGTAGR